MLIAKSTVGVSPQADMRGLEFQIDELAYQRYGLTEEEVKIVDGKG